VEVHCLRDLTRGGMASALNEIAVEASVAVAVDEGAVLVRHDVRGACEMLGLDPFYVANEGRFVAFVPASQAGPALEALRECEVSRGAAVVGNVESRPSGQVTVSGALGVTRMLPMLSGEQLPRIC
ncbi:MAG: hydrogenase expression/formation protein HypE, partial [Acidobacteria bacterium]